MYTAYQITEDDIENVLFSNKNRLLYASDTSISGLASEIFSILDFQLIEDAALFGDTMEEQTDYAYGEITRQLVDLKILDKELEYE